jgi:hypothetical protein
MARRSWYCSAAYRNRHDGFVAPRVAETLAYVRSFGRKTLHLIRHLEVPAESDDGTDG